MNAHPVTPLALTINQAAAALAVTRKTIYALISRGELHAVRIGARQRIAVAETERLLEVCTAPGDGAAGIPAVTAESVAVVTEPSPIARRSVVDRSTTEPADAPRIRLSELLARTS